MIPGSVYDRSRHSGPHHDLRALQDPFSAISLDKLRPQGGINIPVPIHMFNQTSINASQHYYPPPPQKPGTVTVTLFTNCIRIEFRSLL